MSDDWEVWSVIFGVTQEQVRLISRLTNLPVTKVCRVVELAHPKVTPGVVAEDMGTHWSQGPTENAPLSASESRRLGYSLCRRCQMMQTVDSEQICGACRSQGITR